MSRAQIPVGGTQPGAHPNYNMCTPNQLPPRHGRLRHVRALRDACGQSKDEGGRSGGTRPTWRCAPGPSASYEAESGLDGVGVADYGVVCGLVVGEELKSSPRLLLTQGGRT